MVEIPDWIKGPGPILAEEAPDVLRGTANGKKLTDMPKTTPGLPFRGHIAQIANFIKAVEPGVTLYTYGGHPPRGDAGSIDVQVGNDRALGNRVFQLVINNADGFSLEYAMWQAQMFGTEASFVRPVRRVVPQNDFSTGSDPAHRTHVHITPTARPGPNFGKVGVLARGVDAVNDAAGVLGDLMGKLGEGILTGLVMAGRYVYYALVIVPTDYGAGFSWELVKRVGGAGMEQTEGMDILGLLKGDVPEGRAREYLASLPPITRVRWDQDTRNRFYALALGVMLYQLAFGQDRQGNEHLGNILQAGNNLPLTRNRGEAHFNESAVLSVAKVKGKGLETADNVASRNRSTGVRPLANDADKESKNAVSKGKLNVNKGSGLNDRSRDESGKFRARRTS